MFFLMLSCTLIIRGCLGSSPVEELYMKKIYLLMLLISLTVSAVAEEISSVAFNPSRLGQFTHLKVSGKATLHGGIDGGGVPVADLYINSNGSVVMQNNTEQAGGLPEDVHPYAGSWTARNVYAINNIRSEYEGSKKNVALRVPNARVYSSRTTAAPVQVQGYGSWRGNLSGDILIDYVNFYDALTAGRCGFCELELNLFGRNFF